jgi:hypothetical protein
MSPLPYTCAECENPVPHKHDLCADCAALDCVGCRDTPQMGIVGPDNMDFDYIPCHDCGREGPWDY